MIDPGRTSQPSAPPADQAEPRPHTTVIATDYAPRIIVQSDEDDGRWFRCLNWFYDEIVPGLPGAPLKLMLGMLRHRDNQSGMVTRTRQQFIRELGLSAGAISGAFSTLTTHPARLLAVHGPSLFEPLPGRSFAGRPTATPPAPTPPTPVHPDELPARGVQPNEREFSRVNRAFISVNEPSRERGRARPTRLDETRTPDQTAGGIHRSGRMGGMGRMPNPTGSAVPAPAQVGGGWPEPSLFGRIAIEQGDVRKLLEDLRVGPPALDDVMREAGLRGAAGCERVLSVAREVAADPTAINKPACLAGRLLGRKLARGVDARGRGRLNREELAAMAGLQQLRENKRRPWP